MAEVQEQTIIVDGGYAPDKVKFKKGVPARLIFKRVSNAGCVDQIVVGDGEAVDLPLNEDKSFDIDTSAKGEIGFHCGMDMVRGKVKVK